jgi:hypothetical protein
MWATFFIHKNLPNLNNGENSPNLVTLVDTKLVTAFARIVNGLLHAEALQ